MVKLFKVFEYSGHFVRSVARVFHCYLSLSYINRPFL